MVKKTVLGSAAICAFAALCSASFGGCASDGSEAREDGVSTWASAGDPAASSSVDDPAAETLDINISISLPHLCDLGFVGGGLCDQYCKSQRGTACGYCVWNDNERRSQCQCQSDKRRCSQ